MANPADAHWRRLGAMFHAASTDAFRDLPHPLDPRARLIFVPLVRRQVLATWPTEHPLAVQLAPVLGCVRDTATEELRMRTLLVQNAATQAVNAALPVASFAGDGRMHGDYVVVPVLDLDAGAFAQCPMLRENMVGNLSVPRGFVDCLAEVVLEEATAELSKPQPGGNIHECMKLEPGAARQRAARRLLGRVAASISAPHLLGRLFDDLCTVASLRYENRVNRGGVVLARRGHPSVIQDVVFAKHVALSSPTWARKVLQLSSPALAVLCDEIGMFGLGRVAGYDASLEDLFEVRFVDHHRWHLVHASTVLLDVRYGVPDLPRPRLTEPEFGALVTRVFGSGTADVSKLWELASAAMSQCSHGALLVVSFRAGEEAARLQGQSTVITPLILSAELVTSFAEVDGAVLMDPTGKCFAFGVILDGMASARGTPARGARYNSSVRYVDTAADARVLALVISEDGHVNPVTPFVPQPPATLVAALPLPPAGTNVSPRGPATRKPPHPTKRPKAGHPTKSASRTRPPRRR